MTKQITSDFNLQKINTQELTDNLKASIEYGDNVFIVGQRGSGKSVISKETIKECGMKEIYLNMSVLEKSDFSGFPNFFAVNNGKNDYVSYLLPEYLKPLIEGNDPCVVLFDEVDKVDASILAPLLEFTQFHTMNGKAMKNVRSIIMTANLQAEGGSRPPLPLLDRCEKFLLEASHKQWLEWAGSKGRIHPSITAYVADHPEDLFGDVDIGECYSSPSPRSWEMTSKLLTFGEEQRKSGKSNIWSDKILTTKVSGNIGKKVGIKYAAYFDHYQVLLPIIERIIKGETVQGFGNLEQSKQMVACMITCSRLSRALDDRKPTDKTMPAIAKTVGEFLKTVDPEMSLIAVRSQIGLTKFLDTGLDDVPEFDFLLRSISQRMNG